MEASLDFSLVPYADVLEYLRLNNQNISEDSAINHQTALDLIYSGQPSKAPPSISDLIIAYNLKNLPLTLPTYKASEILLSQDISMLQDLSNRFLLPDIDKERILRILGFLGRLDNDTNVFDYLPVDILNQILRYLECTDVILICRLSTQFSQFCTQNLKLILQEKLTRHYNLYLKNHTGQQLVKLCKLTETKIFATANSSIMVTKNSSTVYGLNVKFDETQLNKIPNIQDIAFGSSHWLVLTKNGLVYSWGWNQFGVTGFDLNIWEVSEPTVIPALSNMEVVQIAAKYRSSMALTREGTVYAFGHDISGQLGLGSNEKSNMPTLIPNLENVIQITTNGSHSLALLITEHVYSFGSNQFGQLGLEDNVNRNIPTLITTLENIAQVAAGDVHSLFLTRTGEVYACGSNVHGQLGLGPKPDYILRPTLVKKLSNIIQINCGHFHSLVLTKMEQVYAFGANYTGQLGLGHKRQRTTPALIKDLSDIIYITTGDHHSIIVKNTGEIYGFGDNSTGAIGAGSKIQLVPKMFAKINL